MNLTQQFLPTKAYTNRSLFTDYYLSTMLREQDWWKDAMYKSPACLAELQTLYNKERENLPHYSEEQLERHWFRPVLNQLGHHYETQAPIPGLDEDGIKRPDYLFFSDEASRMAALAKSGTAAYSEHALSLAEVKRWELPLNKKVQGGDPSFTAQNPSWQIDYYLRASGLSWAILSNGRTWRLVHVSSSYKLTVYYEVDLVQLLQANNPDPFRYFYCFFHQQAVKPHADTGQVFLDTVLQGSRDYAVAVERDLQENAYQALEQLMQGFLDVRQNKLGAADIQAVFQNSLYLLYRLLFILYAETEGLLPINNRIYAEQYGLSTLKLPPTPQESLRSGQHYWARLQHLFDIINGTDPDVNRELGVPRYNGGLFDSHKHRFLEQHRVGDRALVQALKLLIYRQTGGSYLKVDYRALGVRQLGSIYEGLLEYQPRYATENMVSVRHKNGEQWQPESHLKKPPPEISISMRRQAGQLYLETDKGERKSSGSYYTPEYVVEYMVENTLSPLIEAIRAELKTEIEQQPKSARRAIEQSFGERVLQLKILDPAMGSGHFLVAAADYLALAIVTDPYMAIAEELEAAHMRWKRRVVEHCLYGVDKNPLAVELAKLSLWLSTVAQDMALNFLDHHLRCGDALVGATVAQLGDLPPLLMSKATQAERAQQYNLFQQRFSEKLPTMLSQLWEILGQDSDTYEAVHAKDDIYQTVQAMKAPFEAVADLWVSAYFGHAFSAADYDAALDALSQPDRLFALPVIQQAQAMQQERFFFHWELVFPEVFFDEQGQPRPNPGFDGVIGNPPYVRQETLGPVKAYYQDWYSVYHGMADLYVYFFDKGHTLLKKHGLFSFISSNKFMRSNYGAPLRQRLADDIHIREIIDFGELPVFADAATFPAIFITEHAPSEGRTTRYTAVQSLDFDSISQLVEEQGVKLLSSAFEGVNWSLGSVEETDLLHKLDKRGQPLGEYVDGEMRRGIITGYNKAFIIDASTRQDLIKQDPKSAEIIKSLVVGNDIRRYHINFNDNYLIWTYVGIDMGRYPAIFDYLEQHKSQLEKRWDKGNHWYELRACDYYDDFAKNKIIYPDIGSSCRFCMDNDGLFSNNTTYFIPRDDYYLLGILNSKLSFYYLKSICAVLGDADNKGRLRFFGQYLSKLPVRRIAFSTPAETRHQLLNEAISLHEKTLAGQTDTKELLRLTQHALDEGQADFVHDFLAHLAQQMIAANQEQQRITTAFWLDLEGVTASALFQTLRTKGKWEQTLAREEACAPHVSAESRSTRTLNESLAWSEAAFKSFLKLLQPKLSRLSHIIEVYREHAPAYQAAQHRLTPTDNLIDQLVYQLYGLTLQEINMVEGE